MKSIAVIAVVGALSIAGAAFAGGNGPSATGGSHLLAHNVFGLQTLELQSFGFNARIKPDGSADGWYTYHEVDHGVPYVFKGLVACLTVNRPGRVERRRDRELERLDVPADPASRASG